MPRPKRPALECNACGLRFKVLMICEPCALALCQSCINTHVRQTHHRAKHDAQRKTEN